MRIVHVAFAVALAGCNLADFDISQSVPPQTVPGSPLPGPLATLFPIPINLDIQQQIQAMDSGPIGSVTLQSLELSITSAGDWSFVDTIEVYVSSTAANSTLPKVEIAHVTSPGAVTTMHFDCDGSVDLKPYVDEGSQVDGQSSGRAPPQDVTYDGESVFHVHPL